jgi:hypothetical protein
VPHPHSLTQLGFAGTPPPADLSNRVKIADLRAAPLRFYLIQSL